jgi:hypothetical protein
MFRTLVCCLPLVLLAGATRAEEPVKDGDKELSGMSIVGNDDAPKSLVIVPWKTSSLGETLDVSRALGDGRGPVDREVFLRELHYYQIRSEAPGTRDDGTHPRPDVARYVK